MRYALVRDALAHSDEEAANEVKRPFKVGQSGVGMRGNGRQSRPQLRNGTEGGGVNKCLRRKGPTEQTRSMWEEEEVEAEVEEVELNKGD